MNTLKRFLISLTSLLLFSGIALAAPAAARDGGSGSSGSDDSTITTVADDNTTSSGDGSSLAEQFREQAKEKLQAARQNAKEQSQEHRQQACEARKANLTKRMSQAVTQAEKHKAVFDKIYTRVKDFYTNKNLNVADYTTLTANVDTAAATAQTQIDALKALDVNVDCSSQTVADSVSAFQTAVKSTRDSLKAYRDALTDLINSLKGASTGTNSSTDNSTDNSTTNTTNQ